MNARVWSVVAILCLSPTLTLAQSPGTQAPRVITLGEAVDLALAHNHVVRLAALKVEEHEQAKEAAKSAYFPTVHNDSNVVRVSDTQLVEIPAGSFGAIAGNLIPQQSLILNQGGQTFASNGTGLIQPLTQLLKIGAANDVARA